MGVKFYFSKRSERELATIVPELAAVVRHALGYGVMDFTVVCGRRCKAEQDRLYNIGKSMVKYPNSKHNVEPLSYAVDLVPYVDGDVSWKAIHCAVLAGLMLAAAKELGVVIRWGGCWSGNPKDIGDQRLNDYVHYEVTK
jgi:peptidoglycan L-alanyl-D-glutamate endopeptidase CwlK